MRMTKLGLSIRKYMGMHHMSKVIIIGCGASGMMAGIAAGEQGHEVHIFEKNEKAGKKLFITGKGRCNLTNDCTPDQFFTSVVHNPKFLFSSYYSFDTSRVQMFFKESGVHLKTERGARVFPSSDHSSDIIRALEAGLKKRGAKIHYRSVVKDIHIRNNAFYSIELSDGSEVSGDSCIIATGGLSYPSTGSTGDGMAFAKKLGHTIVEMRPALVPIETTEEWTHKLQGLSLRNVRISVSSEEKVLYEELGEMLFTHFGVSGPLILIASSIVGDKLTKRPLRLLIDLKPALDKDKLDQRVLRDFSESPNKNFINCVSSLFPAKLLPIMVELSRIPPDKKVNEITRVERLRFVDLMKELPITLSKLRGYDEAIIMSGGVCTSEVNPATMESRIVHGVFLTGEVLDTDALTGGFNLQIAWSTGYAAGMNQ